MLTFNFSLVLYYLAAFGLAYIAGHSVISEPLRTFVGGTIDRPRPFFGWIVSLVECPACFGTWIGALAGALDPSLFLQGSVLMGAGVGALTTCAINLLLGKRAGLMPGEPDPMKERIAALMEFAARQMIAGPGYGVTMGTVADPVMVADHDDREEVRREMVERGMLPDEMSIGAPLHVEDMSAEDFARFSKVVDEEIERSRAISSIDNDMSDLVAATEEDVKAETEGLA